MALFLVMAVVGIVVVLTSHLYTHFLYDLLPSSMWGNIAALDKFLFAYVVPYISSSNLLLVTLLMFGAMYLAVRRLKRRPDPYSQSLSLEHVPLNRMPKRR